MSKNVVTAALLVFVATAVAVIAIQEWHNARHQAAAGDADQSQQALDLPGSGVVVFYLHGDRRCSTCIKLETLSEEAVVGGFSNELDTGAMSWRVVNTDQPQHAHFITDFELTNKALVVAEYHNGELVRWQNLALIWHLVDEKEGFLKYVRDAIHDFSSEA
jgi:hypothetical protein